MNESHEARKRWRRSLRPCPALRGRGTWNFKSGFVAGAPVQIATAGSLARTRRSGASPPGFCPGGLFCVGWRYLVGLFVCVRAVHAARDKSGGISNAPVVVEGSINGNNWIYRGDIFLNVTAEHLLYKGDHRKPEDRDRQKRTRPAKGDTIEERPREVADRETFGNWEMDSIIGCKGSKAALVVLTERLTRYPVIFRVPDGTRYHPNDRQHLHPHGQGRRCRLPDSTGAVSFRG